MTASSMTFLTELKEVLANANNALAGVFLRTHAKEIIALVEAAENLINSPDEDSDANAYFELQSALAAFKEQP